MSEREGGIVRRTPARARRRGRRSVTGAAVVLIAICVLATVGSPARAANTTPIEHLVVVFDENISFDHYFGTYPNATNPPGEPSFTPAPGTPPSQGLTPALLSTNPNSANPARLDRALAVTCGQDHGYTSEQRAFDGGLMDKFVQFAAGGSCVDRSIVMDYYDGNTVTGLWNIAQNFAMSDANFGSTYGPSTPGALNLVAGNTHGAAAGPGVENGTVIGDPNPLGDDCGNGTARLAGANIGDRMSTAGMTWGWFQGGFRPTSRVGDTAVCGAQHTNLGGGTFADYSAHHEPFQYYASTLNAHHLPPTSTAAIGRDDQANHQYDLQDFDAAVQAGNLPQVSFLKAASFEDGHAGNSGPLDEQRWIARVLDELQQSAAWASTAVLITYDDSDGWYDHAFTAPTNSSMAPSDALSGVGVCGPPVAALGGYQDRCGPGPRLPLLVVSPWVTPNSISSAPTEQASIIKFVEDNWGIPRIGDSSFDAGAGTITGLFDFNAPHARAPKLFLDPTLGTVLADPPGGVTAAPPTPPVPGAPAPPPLPPPAAPDAGSAPLPGPAPVTGVPAPVTGVAREAKPKLAVTARRGGRRVTVTLKVTGLGAGKATAVVRLRRAKSASALASARGTLRSGGLKLTLKARRTVRKGAYTLSVTITQGNKHIALRAPLKLR